MRTTALEARGLCRSFGALRANDSIDFTVNPGEVHVLLGENGAGKSTLMNLLYGMLSPDSGEILREGRPIRLASPQEAIAQGIGMVHQHFMLVPVFTVTENVMLGSETIRGPEWIGRLDREKVAAELRSVSTRHGLAVDPEASVETLSVGEQQRVEIVKALYRRARVLILDEPTAVLTPAEADALFGVMRGLCAEGVAIVFITHKLREALAIADRITVMRGGRVIASVAPDDTDEAGLAELMVGREVSLGVERAPSRPGMTVLSVSNLCVRGGRGLEAVRGVTFEARAGEIVGVAGVQGNGQSELVEALVGLRAATGGTVNLLGLDVTHAPPRSRLKAGLALVPEDRHRHGVIAGWSVSDNLALGRHAEPPFARRGLRQFAALAESARRLMAGFDVRAAGPDAALASLSGGNQQKVVLARALSGGARLLIFNQPTRGVDVGAIERLHREIVAARAAGAAVLLVSAELDEVLALSDRLLVMLGGRVVAEFSGSEATREAVGRAMGGA